MQAAYEEPFPNVREVKVLHIVALCFNKYDNVSVNSQGIENITTNTIEEVLVEDVRMEDNLLV